MTVIFTEYVLPRRYLSRNMKQSENILDKLGVIILE